MHKQYLLSVGYLKALMKFNMKFRETISVSPCIKILSHQMAKHSLHTGDEVPTRQAVNSYSIPTEWNMFDK